MLRLNYTVASDRGLVRGNNEDSAYAGPHLLALADGMGGHAAGEVASQIMITHLEHLDQEMGDNDMLALLAAGADEANRAIADEVGARPETQGMGTTLTALAFNGREFGLCHVGDSRGYRLREGKLEQITVDDTYVQSLVNEGRLLPEDVSTHPQRSLILKAYTGREVEPTLKTIDALPGDRLLLCSDGLSDPVTHSTIEENLAQGTPAEAAQKLVELALRSGGPDNVTVVVADVVDAEGLDKKALAELPTKPATAGALCGEPSEESHPDTAAGRAAALRTKVTTVSPDGQVSSQPLAGVPDPPEAAEDPEESKESTGRGSAWRWGTLIVALVALIGLIVGGWWVYHSAKEQYFLATDDSQAIVVEQGLDYSVLGTSLHEPYQHACLGEDASVRLTEPGANQDCHRFSLSDLPESARSSVESMPAGSYEEINQQLRRLADQALPACVTLHPEAAETAEATETTEATESAEPTVTTEPTASISATERPLPEDLPQPGVQCREVK
ncbi:MULTISPECIES: PP2C family protein-serine/threonine phosphatase [unclassified Corynebacterium]|uniref:PP2C family protein-serine/threonine phosphatase n=1 Tax=unclassified Corynebacterium TaxID=2624378 RepID=UPI0029CA418D|nr:MULTISPECIES: protein phosphatase 2C domain-containing protein [unclassified Corynebacterium]WPF66190.1 protein phosphatase 2C domain-containing protein [Corynebacterium sp. 22KM0430]WPF68682.1 protein phosphatase 2C domain-containing protein [Corynebacterium sp. 21KM1197]